MRQPHAPEPLRQSLCTKPHAQTYMRQTPCRGVASWDWYYPYYFAPMASELVQLDEITSRRRVWGVRTGFGGCAQGFGGMCRVWGLCPVWKECEQGWGVSAGFEQVACGVVGEQGREEALCSAIQAWVFSWPAFMLLACRCRSHLLHPLACLQSHSGRASPSAPMSSCWQCCPPHLRCCCPPLTSTSCWSHTLPSWTFTH